MSGGLSKLGVDAVSFDFPSGFSKAGTNKVALCFLADFLRTTTAPELKFHAVMTWAITKFANVLHHGKVFLTDDERRQAAECGLLYCRLHVLLARQALENGRPRFKVRPRLHQFVCEIILKLRAGSRLNPKYTACFADESFVGRMCAIGKSNVHPSTMGLRLLRRMLMQLNSHIVSARR